MNNEITEKHRVPSRPVSGNEPEMGQRLLFGTGLNVLGGVFGQAITFISLMVGLSRVGTEAYGVVALALSVTQLPLLLEKGMGVYVLGAMNLERGNKRRTPQLAVSVVGYMALGLMTLLIGLFVSHVLLTLVIDVSTELTPSATRAFDIMAFAAFIRVVFTFTARSLMAENKLPTLRLIELARDSAALVFTFILVGDGPNNMVWVASSILISDLVAAAVSAIVARSTWRDALYPRAIDAAVLKDFLHSCKPYIAIVASGALLSRADPFIIGVVLGPSALALHAVALRIFQLFSGAIDLLCLGVMSGSARLCASGESERIGGLYRKASSYAALVIWPVVMVAIPNAGYVADRFMEFDEGEFVGVLRTVMVLVLVTVPISQAWAVVFGSNSVSGLVRPQWIAAMVSFTLTVVLVKPLGVTAVFFGSIAGTLVAGFFLLPAINRISGQSVKKLLSGFGKPGLLAVVLLVALVASSSLADIAIQAFLSIGALGLYGIAAISWAVLAEDRQRLLRGLTRR